jgi:hypothetical protein
MADNGGWVQVQHKKPHQSQTQAQQQQRQKPPTQQRNGNKDTNPLTQQRYAKQQATTNNNVNRTTPVRPKSLPINTPSQPTIPPEKIGQKTPPKPLPTAIASPPKSILAYGETNPFDLDDDMANIDIVPQQRQKSSHKKPHVHKPTKKEEPTEIIEEEEEPLTHFFAMLPPEVAMYVLTFFDLKLLCSFSEVSKFCYNFAVDDALWKPLFRRDWGGRRGGGTIKRKKRVEPSKGKWRPRYLQLFLNKRNSEKDKLRADMRMLIFYTKTFNLNMKKARQANNKLR